MSTTYRGVKIRGSSPDKQGSYEISISDSVSRPATPNMINNVLVNVILNELKRNNYISNSRFRQYSSKV